MALELADIDDVKGRTPENYFEGRICCKCRNGKTYINNSGTPKWHSCHCSQKDCTGWLCNACFMSIQNSLPDSYHSAIKSMAKHRRGQLRLDSEAGKGLIGEVVVAKVRRLKDMNIDTDNFHFKFDISPDKDYGIIQVKFRISRYDKWGINTRRLYGYHTLFIICISKDKENVERVYAIPEKFRIDEKPYNDAYVSLMRFFKDKRYFGVEDVKKFLIDA